ncbi:AmiS/UreI family transporter [Pseudonocardia acaciae]|uniref:AmiS/UreI family transporter n=1 Tax=Pseudonocardia acaciae TaxID=551276 RepID=UPI00048F837D|nr:AmiS/UreI family transporter [Pseudonocardia acaciae]
MLLGVVLLYVGAVLCVNGIWLIGQAAAVPAGAEGEAQRERSPLFIQNREVAVLNIFTGFVGVVIAVIFLVQGGVKNDLSSVRSGGYIFLFAFTYLWVAFNQFLDAGGRAFGWYCLFVAVTAVPAGIYTLAATGGNPAVWWLGLDWFAWAVLWGLFWALLALGKNIARPVGWLTIAVGIVTAWALGFAILVGALAF